jgi:hypothetical protein
VYLAKSRVLKRLREEFRDLRTQVAMEVLTSTEYLTPLSVPISPPQVADAFPFLLRRCV